MRAILFLALVFSLVSCEDLIPHTISLKRYPTLGERDGNKVEVLFQFTVHKKVTVKDVTDELTPQLKVLILPPPYLTYKDEKTKFAPASVPLSTGSTGGAGTGGGSSGDLSTIIKNQSCPEKHRITVLNALEADAAAIFGFYTKKALASELRTVVVDDLEIVEIELEEDADLEPGDYEWTGNFEFNDDIKKTLGTSSYFNEFVVALAIKDLKAKTKIEYCHTENPTAAAMLFKKVESTDSILDCVSTDVRYIAEGLVEFPFHKTIQFFASLVPSPLPEYKFKLRFEMKKDTQYDDIGGDEAVIFIGFPKEFAKQGMFGDDLCDFEFEPKFDVKTCKYNDDYPGIFYLVDKKNIKEKKLSITLDLTNKYLKSNQLKNDELKFELFIFYDRKAEVKPDIDTAALQLKLVSLDDNKEACANFYNRKLDFEYTSRSKTLFPVVSGKTEAGGIYESSLVYTLKSTGANMLVLFNLRLVRKMDNKNFKLRFGFKDYGYLKEPDKVDPVTGETIPENKGVTFDTNEVIIDLTLSTGYRLLDPDSHIEYSFAFKTRDGSYDRVYKDDFFNVSYSVPETRAKYLVKHVNKTPKVETVPVPSHSNGITTIAGPHVIRDYDKYSFVFKITSEPQPQMLYHFKFNGSFELEEPTGLYTIGNETHPFEFSSKGEGSFYLEKSDRVRFDVTVELTFKVGESSRIKSVDFDIISNYKDIKHFNPKIDTYFYKANIDLKDVGKQPNYILPCVNAYSWMYSSQHRSGENDVYLFSRLSDCRRPWMPFNHMFNVDRLDLDVATENKTPAITTLLEKISLSNPKTHDIAKKLMKANKFYEHFLYIFVDKDAFDAIKKQMVAVELCKNADSNCPDHGHTDVLKLYLKTIFSKTKTDFTKFVLAYYEDNSLKFYTVDKIDSEPELKLQSSGWATTEQDAFKTVLSNAVYYTKGSVLSSFSVIAVVDDSLDDITSQLERYDETNPDPLVHYSIPYYVDVIRVDKSATVEEGIVVPEPKTTIFTREMIKKETEPTNPYGYLENRETYYDLNIGPTNLDWRKIQFTEEPPKLQGSISAPLLPESHFEFTFYFGITPKIETVTVETASGSEPPVITEFKKGLTIANKTLKGFVALAGATSFQTPKDGLDVNSFSLKYRGVSIGKHMIMSSFAGPEKLYGECDLLSLYKYFPTTPHFSSKTPVAPLVTHKHYLFADDMTLKYGAYGERAVDTMFIDVVAASDNILVNDSNLPAENKVLAKRLSEDYYSSEDKETVSEKVKTAQENETQRKQKVKELNALKSKV